MEGAEEMGEKHVSGQKLTPHQLFYLFYKLRIIQPRAKKSPNAPLSGLDEQTLF